MRNLLYDMNDMRISNYKIFYNNNFPIKFKCIQSTTMLGKIFLIMWTQLMLQFKIAILNNKITKYLFIINY